MASRLHFQTHLGYDCRVSRVQLSAPVLPPVWRRVRPGVRPRGAAGYAGRDMGLSEARKPVVGCVTN